MVGGCWGTLTKNASEPFPALLERASRHLVKRVVCQSLTLFLVPTPLSAAFRCAPQPYKTCRVHAVRMHHGRDFRRLYMELHPRGIMAPRCGPGRGAPPCGPHLVACPYHSAPTSLSNCDHDCDPIFSCRVDQSKVRGADDAMLRAHRWTRGAYSS